VKQKDHKILARRKRNLDRRLDRSNFKGAGKPIMAGGNIRYEMSGRVRATHYGGVGAIHQLVRGLGLEGAFNASLPLLKVHLPYCESDHILNLAYNVATGGRRLEDIEDLRQDEAYLDALGAERIPDPTTAGDFCRRFDEASLLTLMEAINDTRERVWHWRQRRDKAFFDRAVLDIDGTIAATRGECKRGMGLSYKGIWGYLVQMISLANTGEPLYLVTREGNEVSHQEIAEWIERAIERVGRRFKRILLRGDTDFSLTEKLDEWDEKAEFVFGYDAMPNLIEIAEGLAEACWERLERAPKYEVKTQARGRRPNVKAAIVRENGYLNLRLRHEEVAEFDYRPGKCRKTYRMVVVRKNLSRERGEHVLFDEVRYFFYITNIRDCGPDEIVGEANRRCDQENLFGQFHGGMSAMRMPLDSLHANWAYLVTAALAWSLKAWYGLLIADEEESRRVVRMEYKQFLRNFIMIPCQIVRTGRRLVHRVLGYNRWLRTFFKTYEVIGQLGFT
jgi:hypothetical protein